MTDIKKQIDYWISNSFKDIETAELLISNGKILHGLFFCHLSVEKAIKANIVKFSNEFPPKSHNLIYLTEKASLEFPHDYENLLGILMKYQLEGRYPDYNPEIPSMNKTVKYFEESKKLIVWLKEKL